MLTRLNHRILIFALILLSANLFVQAEDLCMEGTLLFREDFGGNDPNDPVAGTDPAPGMTSNYMQIFDTATCIAHYPCTGMGSGRYLLTKIGYRNASSYTYSHWFIMDDHTFPNDYTRGYLLEIDGRTDNATLFETVINGLCEGTKLTFSAYVTNITTAYSYDHGNNGDPQLSFVLQDPVTGEELITPYKTGPIPVDRSYQGIPYEWRNSAHWQLVGMNFTVPAGRTAIKLLIKNACTASGGNDFAMDDIEIRLCAPPVTIDGEADVCEKAATSLSADFTNDGTFAEPLEYKWWHSEDSVTWTELSETTALLSLAAVQKSDSGWYKVAVSGADNIASVNCRAISEPFLLSVKACEPSIPPCPELLTITVDTTVCDTLMPYRWRDTLFTEPATYEILYKNQRGCDSVLHILTLNTKVCCPDLHYATRDTTVCDTLMPYTWHGLLFDAPGLQTTIEKDERGCDTLQTTWTLNTKFCCPDLLTVTADTVVCDTLMPYRWRDTLFTEPAKYKLLYKDRRGCDSLLYILTLDTIYCERPDPPTPPDPECYPIIVNKYNWVLLVDNIAVQELFPNRRILNYQWYKNGEPIPGANEDDYSEHDELHGDFQMILMLDGDEEICSNILEINIEQQVEEQVHVRIFNSHGMPVREDRVTHGIYLYRYEQGDKVWVEKKLIP